jgi:uncharacterized membrane protein
MGGMEPGDDDVAQPSGRRPCHLSVGGFEISMVAGREGSQVPRSDMSIPWLGRHWLFAVNLAMALFIGGTLLPPVLMSLGLVGPAQVTYKLYGLNCHQLPERSYFLFGPQVQYSLAELRLRLGTEVTRYYVGEPALGYKVAICQRCVAMYGAILAVGLLYGLLRRKENGVRPLSWWCVILLLVPVALDGGGQLIGLWESTWWVRTITGVLFGAAWVGWIYPYLDEAVEEMLTFMADVSRFKEVSN